MNIYQKTVFASGLFILLLAGAILFVPASQVAVGSPVAAMTYSQAMGFISRDIQSVDFKKTESECSPLIFDHGKKTARAILIFHGYTNCPKQFEPLARKLFDQGYNVYVPLLPDHGLQLQYESDLHGLTSSALTRFADEQTARALGLGDSLTVMGLSAGANLSLWEAQHDSRIDRAVAIAPVIYPVNLKPDMRDAVINFFHVAPPYFTWWDSKAKDALVTAPYAYKQHSSKADGEILNIGLSFEKNLRAGTLARPVTIVANQDDEAVTFSGLQTLADEDKKIQPSSTLAVFPGRGLPHDVIDPHNNMRTDEVYSFIEDTLAGTKD